MGEGPQEEDDDEHEADSCDDRDEEAACDIARAHDGQEGRIDLARLHRRRDVDQAEALVPLLPVPDDFSIDAASGKNGARDVVDEAAVSYAVVAQGVGGVVLRHLLAKVGDCDQLDAHDVVAAVQHPARVDHGRVDELVLAQSRVQPLVAAAAEGVDVDDVLLDRAGPVAHAGVEGEVEISHIADASAGGEAEDHAQDRGAFRLEGVVEHGVQALEGVVAGDGIVRVARDDVVEDCAVVGIDQAGKLHAEAGHLVLEQRRERLVDGLYVAHRPAVEIAVDEGVAQAEDDEDRNQHEADQISCEGLPYLALSPVPVHLLRF